MILFFAYAMLILVVISYVELNKDSGNRIPAAPFVIGGFCLMFGAVAGIDGDENLAVGVAGWALCVLVPLRLAMLIHTLYRALKKSPWTDVSAPPGDSGEHKSTSRGSSRQIDRSDEYLL